MAGLIAGADIMLGGGPHTRITRDPVWSAGAPTAILTASPPRRYRAGTFSALPQGPGNRFAKRAASAAMRTGTWSRSVT